MRGGLAAVQETTAEKTPPSRRRYTSPAMTERRARIVDAAHRILGEGGVAALTIRRLSDEAGVAQRTLYRLFGDKDGVISATVVDRMVEVREHIARRDHTYTLPMVFRELDWMVSELDRDSLYARVVIDFVFAPEVRTLEVNELTSVARSRFAGWLEHQRGKGSVRGDLDNEALVDTHVMHEFLVYRRWSLGQCGSEQCRLELHACFLQSASLVLTGELREVYLAKLVALLKRIRRMRK
ncbi:TetR/AcrR family transcriptional regulator [Novosphingobium sp. P6W]|uniref:TetR/AcrR family transcriptional regulator n=1 Tax=Novosphingobium sp. P6W TaxID=1609758 RepID=UPI0005C52E5D|nr:TetR/AcrR family transcriptional regulator [Novosphingobium sp. P6W]